MAMTEEQVQQRIRERHNEKINQSATNRLAYEHKNDPNYRLHRSGTKYHLFHIINSTDLQSIELDKISEFIHSEEFRPSLDPSNHPGNDIFRIDQQNNINPLRAETPLSFQIQSKNNSHTCVNMTNGVLEKSNCLGDLKNIIEKTSLFSLEGLGSPHKVEFLGVLSPDFIHLIKDCHTNFRYTQHRDFMPRGIIYDGILENIR